ncbi:MAG: exodeoxyribonuclease VII small subunit [Anaerolineaceae bacterium]|jgi:exodeoxyribonuclease VII small subunit|nr:exodeoxyribonuclease VII small subunit [Anaerolineaceae bacterium]HNX46307.1 exodeoxyribonuclease VII small subunit [Anaerolineaceae bacterium]HPT22980.1 exodeoxyribonuclease VII small subunit [Anaerolineaceae bacterium]
MTEQSMDFESAFRSLQEIIARLENSELPLEEAIKLYEEGKRLSEVCANILAAAELRVSTLPRELTTDENDEEAVF